MNRQVSDTMLRIAAAECVAKFLDRKQFSSALLNYLGRLVGAKDYHDLISNQSKYDHLLKALCGEHGHTIFKALLAKNGRYLR